MFFVAHSDRVSESLLDKSQTWCIRTELISQMLLQLFPVTTGPQVILVQSESGIRISPQVEAVRRRDFKRSSEIHIQRYLREWEGVFGMNHVEGGEGHLSVKLLHLFEYVGITLLFQVFKSLQTLQR